ncbi:SLC26A/SulP transporter family protein [Candidatus Dependentiae bacterium]|nr:SLC26A/SulP transporter family protein [Candidatus Dependentiae bacterium]
MKISIINYLKNFISSPEEREKSISNLTGDLFGGLAAMLVALPSAIAFGLIVYSALGSEYSGKAAIAGILGAIALGLIAPIFGGTSKLITAPCAPAAAVLSLFVSEMVKQGTISFETMPFYVTLVGLLAGILQLLIGFIGGGKLIKYIPYPVIAGYLSAVGILIFSGQWPKFLGMPKGSSFWKSCYSFGGWQWQSITIGLTTIVVMLTAPKIIKKIPAAIVALASGIACYFILAAIDQSLLNMDKNPYIIGQINASAGEIITSIKTTWAGAMNLNIDVLGLLLVPFLTLGVLLSVDTLKTCVVLDALTQTRHNSNKELIGQGLGNIGSSLLCGLPGAGTTGPTLVNFSSGAKTRFSGFLAGFFSILVLLFFAKYVAWIPVASLAGILLVVGFRMVDKKSFSLLRHKSTVLDFIVILAVIISALTMSLITAAVVGIIMAIFLFIREQMRLSVVRRKFLGHQKFSKKKRPLNEAAILEKEGAKTIIFELQGQLFFGTTDQLLNEIEPFISSAKYFILEMRRVQSLDFTAANRLMQILNRIKSKKGFLILASVPLSLPTGQNVKDYLSFLGLSETTGLKFFPDLDDALEWAEDEILKESPIEYFETHELTIDEMEFFKEFSAEILEQLKNVMVERRFKNEELIFKRGETGDEIFFIRKGSVKVVLPLAGGTVHHLATFIRGDFFGDMAFLDKAERSANAVASGDTSLYYISREKFDKLTKIHPEIGGHFFEELAYIVSYRLRQTNIELTALQDG